MTVSAPPIDLGKNNLGAFWVRDPYVDIIAGQCAGIISNLVSHPLDTIKTRVQLQSSHSINLRHCIREIYMTEGVSPNTPSNVFTASRLLPRSTLASYGPLTHFSHIVHRAWDSLTKTRIKIRPRSEHKELHCRFLRRIVSEFHLC